MKRIALYVFVAALTFCVGSLAQKLWPNTPPPPAYRQPHYVTLCELTAAPERYDGEEVLVRAVLNRNNGDPFLSDDSCATTSALIFVQADSTALATQGLPEWATYATFCGNDPYLAAVTGWAADVTIIGTFKAGHTANGDSYAAQQPFIVSKSFLQITKASRRQ